MTLQEVNTPTISSGDVEIINKPRTKYTNAEAMELVNRGRVSDMAGRDVVKRSLESLWFRCIAWFVGQNTRGAEALFFNDPDIANAMAETDQSYSANHLFPLVLRQVSRLAQNDGSYEVLPMTPDWTDQRAAKVSERILGHYHAELDFKGVRAEAAMWAVCTGTAFGYTDWDVQEGKKVRVYTNPFGENEAMTEEDKSWLDEQGMFDEQADGSLQWEALSPFQVTLPGVFTRLKDVPWLIIERVRSMEWLWDRYPTKAKSVRLEDMRNTLSTDYWRRLSSIVRNGGFSLGGIQNLVDNEAVVVREFWRPPSRMVKQGARIVACNETLLENSPHPAYEHEVDIRFPLRMMRYAQVPGRFWGSGMVEHLIGPQAEYNHARAQLGQHRDASNRVTWSAPRGSELSPTPTARGDIWEYNPALGPPRAVDPAQLSQAHVLTPEMALADMRAIAAQSEVSQGNTPPNVRSGVAIQALQEHDVEAVGQSFESMERWCQDMGTDALAWCAKFLNNSTAIRIYGQDRATDITYYRGKDMKGNTRVRVVPRSMAPRSRAAAMQNAMELVQIGALQPQTNPEHMRYLLHTLEIGQLDDAFTVIDQNIRRANVENEMMAEKRLDPATGRKLLPPDVQPHDDDQTHLQEHNRFKGTDRWENLDPELKMEMMAHDLKHQQSMLRKVMAAAQVQGLGQPQGQGGSQPKETGTPSPPKREASTTPS